MVAYPFPSVSTEGVVAIHVQPKGSFANILLAHLEMMLPPFIFLVPAYSRIIAQLDSLVPEEAQSGAEWWIH